MGMSAGLPSAGLPTGGIPSGYGGYSSNQYASHPTYYPGQDYYSMMNSSVHGSVHGSMHSSNGSQHMNGYMHHPGYSSHATNIPGSYVSGSGLCPSQQHPQQPQQPPQQPQNPQQPGMGDGTWPEDKKFADL